MIPLTITQTISYGEQARADARKWHESSGRHSPETLDHFEAGFSDGWRQCLRVLKLHGYEFTDPPAKSPKAA